MRLRNEVIGSLNLLRRPAGSLDAADLTAAQALADVATIGILQHRAAEEARLLAEQLQYALNSRVTIEQAKGVLSERSGLDAEAAFAALRRYAAQQQPAAGGRRRGRRQPHPRHRGDHADAAADRGRDAPARPRPATGEHSAGIRAPAEG